MAEPSPGRVPVTNALHEKVAAFRGFLLANLFEVIMGLAALVSLSMFGLRTIDAENKSGIADRMARVVRGEAEVKRSGSKQFVPAQTGQELFDLDAVWTGKGRTVELEFEERTRITLGERTLVILKRPFRKKFKLAIQDQIQVISGEVHLGGGGTLEGVKGQTIFPNTGAKGAGDKKVIEGGDRIFPPDQAILYYRNTGDAKGSSAREIRIAWGKPLSGYLKISYGQEVRFVPVQTAEFASITVPNGSACQWSVIDEQKVLLMGPFSFEVSALDDETAKKLLITPPARPHFVYW